MQSRKRSVLFWVLLIVGICCSAVLFYGRWSAEWNDRQVTCAVTYEDVQLLSQEDGRSVDSWLEDLKNAGVHYLVVTDQNEFEAAAAAERAGMKTGRAGTAAQPGDAFLMPVPPARGVKGYEPWENEPTGAPSVPIALVENYTRTGVAMPENFAPDAWKGPMVKTLYMYDAYSYHYEPSEKGCENGNILFRAVTDRSMRLIVVTPLEYEGGGVVADPEAYVDMLSRLSARLEDRGIVLGEEFSALKAPALNRVLYGGAALLLAALGVLFICMVFPATALFENVLLAVGAVAAAGGMAVLPGLMLRLVPFGAAMIAPCFAALLLVRIAEGRFTIAEHWPLPLRYAVYMAGLVGVTMLGGFYTAALLGTRQFMLEFTVFSGVKAAQLLPLVVTAVLLAAALFGRQGRARRQPTQRVPLAFMIVLAIGVAAALVLLVLRSGDHMLPVADFEISARNWLEEVLYARPRTKEMLMAFPVLALYVVVCDRNIPALALPFGVLAGVGAVSVANTFCHVFTPVRVSIIRTLLSSAIGFVIGLIGMGVLVLILGRKKD